MERKKSDSLTFLNIPRISSKDLSPFISDAPVDNSTAPSVEPSTLNALDLPSPEYLEKRRTSRFAVTKVEPPSNRNESSVTLQVDPVEASKHHYMTLLTLVYYL